MPNVLTTDKVSTEGSAPDVAVIQGKLPVSYAGEFYAKRGHFRQINHDRDGVTATTDRASALQLYYYATPERVSFSSNPLALANLGVTIREGAVYEFMASGHLWGDGTFCNEIRRIPPGHYLHANASTVSILPYWEMRFEPPYKSGGDLNGAIDRDMDLLPSGRIALTLSGGYDSRALLGLLHERGVDFECISYDFGHDYEGNSDADIGAYFAKKLGVRHHFHATTIDGLTAMENIADVIRTTGGESDVAVGQDAMLGREFYSSLSSQYDQIVRGDEVWGWGDRVLTRDMAFWQTYLLRLDQIPFPERLLRSEAYEAGNAFLRAHQREMREEGPKRANDLKDHLYWRHREARLLQPMAQYRRTFLRHEAPFLYGNALDVIRELPPSSRYRKALFRSTMERRFPNLFLDTASPTRKAPLRTAQSKLLADPRMGEFIRHNFGQGLSATLANMLDPERTSAWVDGVFASQNSNAAPRYNRSRAVYEMLREVPLALAVFMAAMASSGRLKLPALPTSYLFRLLTLNLALKAYERQALQKPQLRPTHIIAKEQS